MEYLSAIQNSGEDQRAIEGSDLLLYLEDRAVTWEVEAELSGNQLVGDIHRAYKSVAELARESKTFGQLRAKLQAEAHPIISNGLNTLLYGQIIVGLDVLCLIESDMPMLSGDPRKALAWLKKNNFKKHAFDLCEVRTFAQDIARGEENNRRMWAENAIEEAIRKKNGKVLLEGSQNTGEGELPNMLTVVYEERNEATLNPSDGVASAKKKSDPYIEALVERARLAK